MSLVLPRSHDRSRVQQTRLSPRPWRATLDIAFVNNMPDAALRSTERQFASLLEAAAAGMAVRLHPFTLPDIPRSDEARSYLKHHYGVFDDLLNASFDAAIVTGNEPRAPRLDQEPYWPAMTQLIDWADKNTTTSVWSCLAAHCAVLYLSGITRQRMPIKLSGVFDCMSATANPLLSGIKRRIVVPHSRWNALCRDALRDGGYDMLTVSADAGVDMFALTRRSRFVFLQGHPEYETDTLLREYRRDVGRFLAREIDAYPSEPENYFSDEATKILRAFRRRAEAHRDPALFTVFPNVAPPFAVANRWREPARRFYRNWLNEALALRGLAAA